MGTRRKENLKKLKGKKLQWKPKLTERSWYVGETFLASCLLPFGTEMKTDAQVHSSASWRRNEENVMEVCLFILCIWLLHIFVLSQSKYIRANQSCGGNKEAAWHHSKGKTNQTNTTGIIIIKAGQR